ncbi:undecaprenyldiphospho-muramoylpentapeptide beta-N-acetylglucosaminyltransferase [Paenibacillus mendelii]|uniref:UDP-N-acetylglucosamine--N-acetylmuramyl-(pentapeptide) pyrophosphoryl-undecaprenol N-acetylglucosamine transferase n=1 Tax=Paenibacillus mendelii TaxID=206163 RepID=A0ABV6JBK9_9BACL|nr:undecaprenyldiphospho-muramoylpentapeptide beta-N-acetylglucosaminyltransferase [Paenibacillus mendelii]MCQ6563859.1 undecaprenyldiphospho-muramoylpentapeptide beta-N-acetylglucosaminyltransferase [Paenibacillus mendelii]
MKKIVFTGGGSAGHVTPNLALMARLKAAGWDTAYIGSKDGIEKEIVEHAGVPFHPIASGKLRRYFDVKNFKDPLNVLKGVGQSYRLLRRLKPDIVFSKGGFVSVPVIIGSWLNRIPVIIHESDYTPGLANKIAMPLATRVCVTFPETMRHVRRNKAVCTGLPIREQIVRGKALNGLSLCDFHKQKPVLLVVGGSLGAQKINEAVRASLDMLLGKFQIIHICGKGNVSAEHEGRRGYKQFEFVYEQLPDLFAASDAVVSRAGSTSIFELLALCKPMLLIPLTLQTSRGDQLLNAESFRKQGFARVLFEEDLTPESLLREVLETMKSGEELRQRMASATRLNGTDAILRLIDHRHRT